MQMWIRLREERERLGLTQSAMAKACGVAFRTYCDYESGKSEPKASTLVALGNCGINILYVLNGKESLPPGSVITVTEEEVKLLQNYRALDSAARLNIQAVGDAFAKSHPQLKTSDE